MPAPGPLSASVALRRGGFELDANVVVPPGITVLLGRSGSGKSTLLGAVAGLLRPDRGRVMVGGHTWFDGAAGVDVPVHERGLAFVFQTLALFPHKNARENVEYGIDRALPAAERRQRALSTLERMRVAHLAERRPATFSGGEAQRVALARAFARSPRLVLLDEAFSALDRDRRRALCADVREAVADLGVPAIMVTHHQREAREMASGPSLSTPAGCGPRHPGGGHRRAVGPRTAADHDDDLDERRSGAHEMRRGGVAMTRPAAAAARPWLALALAGCDTTPSHSDTKQMPRAPRSRMRRLERAAYRDRDRRPAGAGHRRSAAGRGAAGLLRPGSARLAHRDVARRSGAT
ncbi:MAG: ATP-binding cassette domain-containing protein [Polyangiaceae bacterium]